MKLTRSLVPTFFGGSPFLEGCRNTLNFHHPNSIFGEIGKMVVKSLDFFGSESGQPLVTC